MDGRYTELAVLPVVRITDATSDITALSYEGDHHLTLAHSAHVKNDWGRYLDAVERIHSTHLAIRDSARRLAGAVEEAPRLSPGQLEMLICPDGFAVPGHGRAA